MRMNPLKITILLLLCFYTFAIAQDGFLGSAEVPVDDNSQVIIKVNPILGLSSLLTRILLFFFLEAMIVLIAFLWFSTAVEGEKNLLKNFSDINSIFSLATLIIIFVCFGDLTYERNASSVGTHLFSIPPYCWLVLAILIFATLYSGQPPKHDNEGEQRNG